MYFGMEIIFSAFLLALTCNRIEMVLQGFGYCDGIKNFKYLDIEPQRIYSRSSQVNVTIQGDHSAVTSFSMSFTVNERLPKIMCGRKNLSKVNSTHLLLSCITEANHTFDGSSGASLQPELIFVCNNQNYSGPTPNATLTLIDTTIYGIYVDASIILGHSCVYVIEYKPYVVGIPTPFEFGMKNGTRCTKMVLPANAYQAIGSDQFTCLFDETVVKEQDSKIDFALFINNYFWRTITLAILPKPVVLQSEGSTFYGAYLPIYFRGQNFKSFRPATLYIGDRKDDYFHCDVANSSYMKCIPLGLDPVEKTQQIPVRFETHGHEMQTIGKPVTFEQTPAPNRETIVSYIKDNVLTISIEYYKSFYIPETQIGVTDYYEQRFIWCRNITINADSSVNCILESMPTNSTEPNLLQIRIGEWMANKLLEPKQKYEMVDLFFFKVAISFVVGLILIYTCLYLLIHFKFKRSFNAQQVGLAVAQLVAASRKKMSGSDKKSITLVKKSFTSLGRSKRSLESKSKAKLEKIKSKSLPKVASRKNLKGILRHKSLLHYKSIVDSVTSLATRSHGSLVLESKSSSDDKNVIQGKSKILPKYSLKEVAKTPAKVSKSLTTRPANSKSKPNHYQYKTTKF